MFAGHLVFRSLLSLNDLQAPVTLDIRSPLDLVYECFVKLGLRYICASRDGQYRGMVSAKIGFALRPSETCY